MIQPPGYHLAELNVGRLVADPVDPRVAEFMGALDRINGLGKRMPGFVWMMEGSGEPGQGNTEATIGNDPRHIANLTVWEDVSSLETFVFGTLHKQFYERRAAWFELMADQHFVMWWVPVGHTPTLEEALEKLAQNQKQGDSEEAFGWAFLEDAKLHRTQACVPVAAE